MTRCNIVSNEQFDSEYFHSYSSIFRIRNRVWNTGIPRIILKANDSPDKILKISDTNVENYSFDLTSSEINLDSVSYSESK